MQGSELYLWAKKLKAFSLKQVAAARAEEEEEEEEEEEAPRLKKGGMPMKKRGRHAKEEDEEEEEEEEDDDEEDASAKKGRKVARHPLLCAVALSMSRDPRQGTPISAVGRGRGRGGLMRGK